MGRTIKILGQAESSQSKSNLAELSQIEPSGTTSQPAPTYTVSMNSKFTNHNVVLIVSLGEWDYMWKTLMF